MFKIEFGCSLQAHEILSLEILTLLLENPTDDSVEVAIGFLQECGNKLTEVSPRGILGKWVFCKNAWVAWHNMLAASSMCVGYHCDFIIVTGLSGTQNSWKSNGALVKFDLRAQWTSKIWRICTVYLRRDRPKFGWNRSKFTQWGPQTFNTKCLWRGLCKFIHGA